MNGLREVIAIHNLALKYTCYKTFLLQKMNEYGGNDVAKIWWS